MCPKKYVHHRRNHHQQYRQFLPLHSRCSILHPTTHQIVEITENRRSIVWVSHHTII